MSHPIQRALSAGVAAFAALMACGCDRPEAGPTTRPTRPPATRQASPAPPTEPGETITNSLGMRLAYVPAGEYVIGSEVSEPGRHHDEGVRRVRITRGFYLGVTEVTQAQWGRLMSQDRSEVTGPDLPVTKVSWSKAVAFCRKLSEAEGRTVRLPTEAEWEIACRAGAATPPTGEALDELAWHMDNSGGEPHPVAAMKANAWGLYDMHGNVAEWCADFYAASRPADGVADPTGPAEGKARVVRGGSFGHFPRACRCAARASYNPAYGLRRVGFRVLMETDPPTQGSRP